jgi:hypothetical protein
MSVNDASRIIIDDSGVALQIVASLTGDSRGVISNCNMFIVQAPLVYSLYYHMSLLNGKRCSLLIRATTLSILTFNKITLGIVTFSSIALRIAIEVQHSA